MRYLLLIYSNETADAQVTEAQRAEEYEAYNAFTNEVRERGAHQGGEALQPVATATTVRVQNGKTLTTDGPFAETKEQLGGYYLLNCKDLDEAISYAAKIPAARRGSIEVRPIMEFE
ncbi:MAG TPA: YciI family protein [Ktedonobacterales bacterium]